MCTSATKVLATTRDPLDGVEGTTTVANPYHYANNDPVNLTDPTGGRPHNAAVDPTANLVSRRDLGRALYVAHGLLACGAAPKHYQNFTSLTPTADGNCSVGYDCNQNSGPATWACNHMELLAGILQWTGTFAAGMLCGAVAGAVAGPLAGGGAAAACGGAMSRFIGGVRQGKSVTDALLDAFNPTKLVEDAAIGVATAGLLELVGVGVEALTAGRSVETELDTLCNAETCDPVNYAGDTTDPTALSDDPPVACPAASFAAATPVVMANGATEKIADVRIGDQVLATDPATGKTSARTVTATMSHDDSDLLDLTISDGNGHEGTLHTTDHHRIWDETRDAWVLAADLGIGDQLRKDNGRTASVVQLTHRPGHQAMFDLTVGTDHSFYVDFGGSGILVHNDPVHGNDATSTSPQHVYAIVDAEGNVRKYGISGRPLNQDGSSPRANGQVNTLKRAGGDYHAEILEKDLPDRATALAHEQTLVDDYYAIHKAMQPGMKRPFPSTKDPTAPGC